MEEQSGNFFKDYRDKIEGYVEDRLLLALVGSFRILRSLIPVLVVIHSSVVSMIFSRSALVSLSSGTYPPTEVIAARNVFMQ